VQRAALILVLIAVAGCSSGDKSGPASISSTEAPKLLLTEADVGNPFVQFDSGVLERREFAPPRDDPTRFGREGGWKSRFRRHGSPATSGPLVIESMIDLFDEQSGAKEDFKLYRESLEELATGAGGEAVAAPSGLGDEDFATTYVQGLAPTRVRYYSIAWREDNVTALVSPAGSTASSASSRSSPSRASSRPGSPAPRRKAFVKTGITL